MEKMMYMTNEFLGRLFEEVGPKESLAEMKPEQFYEEKQRRIALLRDVFKLDEMSRLLDREMEYELERNFEEMSIQIDKYRLSAVKGLDFPVYHVKPAQPKGKVILYFHGHDDMGIMGALTERYDKVRYHKMIPLKLAAEGYDVIAPEVIGHGEACYADYPRWSGKTCGCLAITNYLNVIGFSTGAFRVYQGLKTLDFIEKLLGVSKVTAFGISGGGMTTQNIFPLDERIEGAIVACYSNTFWESTLSREHCSCNYVHGIGRLGDSYEQLAIAAPKKLFTVNGDMDRAFPRAGSAVAFAYLDQVYENLGASDQYEHQIIEGKHEINEDVILAWLRENA